MGARPNAHRTPTGRTPLYQSHPGNTPYVRRRIVVVGSLVAVLVGTGVVDRVAAVRAESRTAEAFQDGMGAAEPPSVHVPDEILEVPGIPHTRTGKKPGIPHTRTGKKLEVPIKRLLQGAPVEQVVNPAAVDTPDLIDHFARLGAERRERSA